MAGGLTFDILPQAAFTLLLIFARLGTLIMVLPALGENPVPARLRLVFAWSVAVLMYPVLAPAFADMAQTLAGAVQQVVFEVLTGLFLGLSVRLVMSTLQIAGSAIAMQTGLGFAQNIDPTQGVQAALFASFLSVFAVTMIFLTDLHFILIRAIADSYTLFRPGALVPVDDFSAMAVRVISGSFRVAVQISAPFLVFGLIFYLGLGILSRLMPQVQIFFLAMPVNILVGFILFMLLLGAIIAWFLQHFESVATQFLL